MFSQLRLQLEKETLSGSRRNHRCSVVSPSILAGINISDIGGTEMDTLATHRQHGLTVTPHTVQWYFLFVQMEYIISQIYQSFVFAKEIQTNDAFIGDVSNPEGVRSAETADGNVISQVPRTGAVSPVTVRNWCSASRTVTFLPGRSKTSGRTNVILLPVSMVI